MAEIIKQTKRSTMEVADQGAKETSLPVPDPPSSDSVYTDMLHSPSWPRLTDEPFIAPPPSREFEDPPEDYDFAGYMSTQHVARLRVNSDKVNNHCDWSFSFIGW